MTTSNQKINSATVWVFVTEAENAGLDVDTEWAKRGTREFTSFVPVEINIRLDDVDKAVTKYERMGDTVRVLRHHKPGYDRFNTVYDC